MTTSKVVWLVLMSLGFYVCGGLCIFKTNMLVGWAQKNYAKSKLVQAYPFFRYGYEALVSHLHSRRRNLHLAVGTRHRLLGFVSWISLTV